MPLVLTDGRIGLDQDVSLSAALTHHLGGATTAAATTVQRCIKVIRIVSAAPKDEQLPDLVLLAFRITISISEFFTLSTALNVRFGCTRPGWAANLGSEGSPAGIVGSYKVRPIVSLMGRFRVS